MPKKPKQTPDEFMASLDHPFKAEVQTLRDIIKGVHPEITEQVKWNAPSFSYKDYLATFNLRATQHVHLVFHNPQIAQIKSAILEGNYPDRRMAYFADMEDVHARKAALEDVIRGLIALMDQSA